VPDGGCRSLPRQLGSVVTGAGVGVAGVGAMVTEADACFPPARLKVSVAGVSASGVGWPFNASAPIVTSTELSL
jgi:hypothetical protein